MKNKKTYTLYSGISKESWLKVWKDKNISSRITNATSDLSFAFDYSYDFNTGKYDDIAIEISNIPIDAFVGFRDEDYEDDQDIETLNNLSITDKEKVIDAQSLFLLDLAPYKKMINIKLLNN